MNKLALIMLNFCMAIVAMEQSPKTLQRASSHNGLSQVSGEHPETVELKDGTLTRTVSSSNIIYRYKNLLSHKNTKTGSIHTKIDGKRESLHGNGFYHGLEEAFKNSSQNDVSKKSKKHKKEKKTDITKK